jgi:hypothetical protein
MATGKMDRNNLKIHAFVISWDGHREKAEKIAASIREATSFLTVIYSNHANVSEGGSGEWVQVPDEFFYGRKFRECLGRFRGDIMLQIQADAECDNWIEVIRSIEKCYSSMPALEIWCPEVDYSYWSTEMVSIGRTRHPGVHLIVQSDGVVWSLTRRSVERLKQLDFEQNNLGWGIELVAISFAFCNKLLAVRDTNVKIKHPKSTGYSVPLAREQQNRFRRQLTVQEQLQFQLISAYSKTRQ